MKIYHNSVICLECGEKLISRHRHDFQSCSCENKTYVDGGLGFGYIRYGGKDLDKIQQFLISSEDKFEDIRFYFERGTYGKDGNEPLHYIKLKDMELNHLEILKDTHEIYAREIKYRKKNGS